MTRLLDAAYFGRLDRPSFFILVTSATAAFAAMLLWLLAMTEGGEGLAALSVLQTGGKLLQLPEILLAHGVSEPRTAGVMSLCAIYVTGALFMLAARGRDIGLYGWPTAFAAMAVFLLAGAAADWLAGLAMLLGAGFALWPSRLSA